jgi:nitroimidazol reductase NimA-like FMN-containing flavoprotein (pyridoxamine 5'-phosphate oxidase superfamily)
VTDRQPDANEAMPDPAAAPEASRVARPTALQASPDASTAPNPTSAAPVDPTLERRAFVRRMSSDAVRTAGSVFGLSRLLTRSAVAAGQAVMGEFGAIQVGNAADESAAPVVAGGPADAPGDASGRTFEPGGPPAVAPSATFDEQELHEATPQATPAAAITEQAEDDAPALAVGPPPRPVLRVDEEQLAILEAATTAVVAINRDGHPPQLTTATVIWDGRTVRFATLGWSRRTTMLRADPRIGLLIDGPADGRFVTVTGQAEIFEGREARDAAWPLLLREAGAGGNEAAEARWQALVTDDMDRAVIVVEPDQVLSGQR